MRSMVRPKNVPVPFRRVQLPGQEHLGRRVAGGQQVLEQVPRVVPAAAGVEVGPARRWAIRGPAVERMAHRVQPRIVPATLLAHEFEQLIGQLAERLRVDAEGERVCVADPKAVPSGAFPGREIEFSVAGEPAPGLGGQVLGLSLEDPSARLGVHHGKPPLRRRGREGHGHFDVLRAVAKLVGAEVNLLGLDLARRPAKAGEANPHRHRGGAPDVSMEANHLAS